jgi:hypothetical protein
MLAYARRTYGARVRIHEPANVSYRLYKYVIRLNGLRLVLYFGISTMAVVVKDRNGVIETQGSRRGIMPAIVWASARPRHFRLRLVGLRDLEGDPVPPFLVDHERSLVHVPAHDVEHVSRVEALFRLALELAA